MKNFWIAAMLVSTPAFAQEDLDARLEALAPKVPGTLGELCASEFGRAAIREKIEALVNHRAGRLDRDPYGHYEERMFVRDETGALRVRPERKADVDRLAAEVAATPRRMAAFNRRALEMVGKIAGDGEMEKKARAWWSDSTFRIAFFTARAGELRELEAADILPDLVGPEPIAAVYATLDQIQALEKSYQKVLAHADEEVRKNLEGSTLFVLARVLRQAAEGAPEPIGAVAEQDTGEKSVAFNVPLAGLVEPFREARKALVEIGPWFEKAAQASTKADETLDFLKNERARAVVAERLTAMRAEQRARADAVFAEILADGFEAKGETLTVKKGRYVGDDQADSPAALEAEHKGVVDGFWGGRYPFDLIAEHCADPKTAEVFASPFGTLALHEEVNRVAGELRQKIADRGFEFFVGLYLEKKGDGFEVRPERVAKVQELAVRAAQIKAGQ
jgi:hypothetical protein